MKNQTLLAVVLVLFGAGVGASVGFRIGYAAGYSQAVHDAENKIIDGVKSLYEKLRK